MAKSEGIQATVNQSAVKAVTTLMIALTDTDMGPQIATNTTRWREPQRHRHSGQTLEKPSFNWNTQDRYKELLSFEMEVMNILKTKI